jgi:hypothetical protein
MKKNFLGYLGVYQTFLESLLEYWKFLEEKKHAVVQKTSKLLE